jgi:hypothetical protein
MDIDRLIPSYWLSCALERLIHGLRGRQVWMPYLSIRETEYYNRASYAFTAVAFPLFTRYPIVRLIGSLKLQDTPNQEQASGSCTHIIGTILFPLTVASWAFMVASEYLIGNHQ